jgi:signal transduction histidine kinase/tetratricopeptide (TPR) repeat protein
VRSGRRLLVIFALAILVPGIVLGGLGLRALVQDGLRVEQRMQQRLDAAVRSEGLRLESSLNDWQQAAGAVARSSGNPAGWPERVRQALATSGAIVVLTGSIEQPQVIPQGRLLYKLSPPIAGDERPASAALQRAEWLELREKRYNEAIALYRQLLGSAAHEERPLILRNLAATLTKAGRPTEALRTYEVLSREPSVEINSEPSDLIATHALAAASTGAARVERAISLYQQLLDGHWALTRETFEFYVGEARAWIPQGESWRQVSADESQKLALTRAAESFVQHPASLVRHDAQPALVFWNAEPFAAIVMSAPFVSKGPFQQAISTAFTYTLTGPGGEMINGPPVAESVPSASYVVRSVAFPLRLSVSPRNPAEMIAEGRRQRDLYLGIVALVVLLLAFGGYFTVKTLHTELAVAQMKTDFVSTVSHEFRSPLTGITQLAEMLRDGRVQDETRRVKYYGMIVNETVRLRRLVENVLDVSRMDEGRKQYHFEPLDSAAWLHELAEDFQTQVATSGFSVETRIPATLPTIMADRETLTTAVHNLLDNAVKYSLTTRSIRIEAAADDEEVRISVSDQGVGISATDRPHIFDRFYRGGGQLARQVKGVGLGLNLVQHIVSAHGGTVAFDSTEGVGSTFIIRLHHGAHPAG